MIPEGPKLTGSGPPIEQATFDVMVQENIEDLDMNPAEALEDALITLKAQNANLLYIIPEHPTEEENTVHKVLYLTNKLKDGDKTVLKALNDELKSDELPKRNFACRNGALHSALTALFEEEMKNGFKSLSIDLVRCSINCFNKQPDWASERLVSLVVGALQVVREDDLLNGLLSLVMSIARKHEANRVFFYHCSIFPCIGKILAIPQLDSTVVSNVCKTIRTFLVDDDIRSTGCRAHDNARELVGDQDALNHLCRFLKQSSEEEETLKTQIILVITKMLVRNEFCKLAADDCGLLSLICDNLSIYGDPEHAANVTTPKLLRPLLLLLKAMCGNDDVKYKASKSANLLISIVISMQKWISVPEIIEAGLTCCHVIALRCNDNCYEFARMDLPGICIRAMEMHETDLRVQKNGAMLIRNMVARNRELQKDFFQHEVEELLRLALKNFEDRDLKEVVKAALRDLDLDAGLKEIWTGAVGSNFKLSYD